MSGERQYPSDLSLYWLESPFEIRQVLKSFAKRAEKISVQLANGEAFTSVVLDVSERGELVLDAAPDPKLNARVLNEARLRVHGILDRVDIDFQVGAGKPFVHDGAPAFQFVAPGKLHKLQRREYFRVPTPVGKPLMCSLFATVDGGKRMEHPTQVLDISLGGICLQEPAMLAMAAGVIYKDCAMAIPEQGPLKFDLAVRHAFDVTNRLGKTSRRAGCEFVNLSPVSQQAVQKFMSKLERDRRSALN